MSKIFQINDPEITFDQLGLRVELLNALETKGYKTPTPIQVTAIPIILDGHDILARAQTGTGKTDAFALPLVEMLSRHGDKDKHPRALVLTPTRELALQVGECIKTYTRRVGLRCTVVHGGVRIKPQIDRLRRGVDVLVATPGRLLDLAGHRYLNLSRVAFVVFDEADRMLDLGFHEEISQVLDLVPLKRIAVLFSATYTQQIRKLAKKMLQDPKYIEVTPHHTMAESVVHEVCLVDRSNKRALLNHLLTRGAWDRALVFCRTKKGADKLAQKLAAQGISSAVLHGDKRQHLRIRILDDFKRGHIRILVATDVAARGLDIIDLPLVVNFDIPRVPEDYVHRIGRTGRARFSGMALSLVCQDEKRYLQDIERFLKQKIPVKKVEGYTEDSDVPDFVLFRPDSVSSEKKADKAIKAIVARRKASKNHLSRSKGSGKGWVSNTKPGRNRAKGLSSKKQPRSETRSPQPSNQGKPRGKK